MYEPGATFYNNKYLLEKKFGNGGFSQVWKALDQHSKMTVALKIFHKQDAKGIELCRNEFVRMQKLKHNHIVFPEVIAHIDNVPFIAMPFYEKGTAMEKKGSLDEKAIANLMFQIADVLTFIHDQGVTHNDLKPDNILIKSEDYYLLTDFGISEELQQQFLKTVRIERQTNAMPRPENRLTMMMTEAELAEAVGMIPQAYRAPELCTNSNATPVKATDIWALGASMYQMVTGETPFMEHGGRELLIHNKNPKVNLDDLIPALPEGFSKGLEKWLKRCLALNTWDRPSAAQIRDAAAIYLRRGDWPQVPVKPNISVKAPFQLMDLVRNNMAKVAYLFTFLILAGGIGLNSHIDNKYGASLYEFVTSPNEMKRQTKPFKDKVQFSASSLDLGRIKSELQEKAREQDGFLTEDLSQYFNNTNPNEPYPFYLEGATAIVNKKIMDSESFKIFMTENIGKFSEVNVLDRSLYYDKRSEPIKDDDRFVISHLRLEIFFKE